MVIIDIDKNNTHVLIMEKTFSVLVTDPTDDDLVHTVGDRLFEIEWVQRVTPTQMGARTLEEAYRPKFSQFAVDSFNEVESSEEVAEKVNLLHSIPGVKMAFCQQTLVERVKLGPNVHQRWGGERVKEAP